MHNFAIGDDAAPLIRCGEGILTYIGVLKKSPQRVAPAALQKMYDAMLVFFRFWHLAKLPVKPKLHMLMHMLERTAWSGNPAFHSTFADEGLNKVLAATSRVAHRAVWELRIFAYFERTETERATKARRAK